MTVVFPFCQKDACCLERLLRWIGQLGGVGHHAAVLIADGKVSYQEAFRLKHLANDIFGVTKLFATEPVEGWIRGSNTLFQKAATIFTHLPFLFVEPDAVPIRATWIDEIEAEFEKDSSKFLGAMVRHNTDGFPNPYLEGCAVYPAGTWNILEHLFTLEKSWTLACASAVVPRARNSSLFQHFWGQPGASPTFIAENVKNPPANALRLSYVSKETALFHRNKDGSLIRLLSKKLFPSKTKIIAVFPVCQKDIHMAMLHARWLSKMNHCSDHEAVISADMQLPASTIDKLQASLSSAFSKVEIMRYPTPRQPYPQSANLAWQHTARHMATRNSPWFWFEADAVALKPDWIEQLQSEYDRGGKPFMGVVVPHHLHLQGTAVYPSDAAMRMPNAMAATKGAFDSEGMKDTNGAVHNAERLIFHLWVMNGGNPKPNGSGEVPRFITAEQLRRWLPKSAVFMHRVKDASVVNLLISGAYAH